MAYELEELQNAQLQIEEDVETGRKNRTASEQRKNL